MSETGLPLYGNSFSFFSSWALDDDGTTLFMASMNASETGTPLWGISFLSICATEVVGWTYFTYFVLLDLVWSSAFTWALDGGVITFLRPSRNMSETGLPLYGNSFSFFSSWALDPDDGVTFFMASMNKSETGLPLYGISFSFFSSWALDDDGTTLFMASMNTSETGLPLYGSSFFSTYAI